MILPEPPPPPHTQFSLFARETDTKRFHVTVISDGEPLARQSLARAQFTMYILPAKFLMKKKKKKKKLWGLADPATLGLGHLSLWRRQHPWRSCVLPPR